MAECPKCEAKALLQVQVRPGGKKYKSLKGRFACMACNAEFELVEIDVRLRK